MKISDINEKDLGDNCMVFCNKDHVIEFLTPEDYHAKHYDRE